MLTLVRKEGEVFWVGEDVQVVVKKIRRNHVRIGILAPDDVDICRDLPPSRNPNLREPRARRREG